MFINDLNHCEKQIGGDNTIIREILHPANTGINLRYSVVHATVKPGKMSQPHKLKVSEVYYILEGEGVVYIGDESALVHAGQIIYIPPNMQQNIRNCGQSDLKFLCIVDPAWRQEYEEILKCNDN